MKILYYTDQIYLHGGLERVLTNKFNYLTKNTNHEVHLLTFQQKNKPVCYPINGQVNFHDINIDYDRKLSFLHPKNILKAPKHFIKLRKKIKEIKPDVIIVCNYEFGFYFIPFLSGNAKTIKEYHSSKHFYDLLQKQNKNILKKVIYKVSDYFESKYNHLALLTKDELNYYKSKNKIVIPNAITCLPNTVSSLNNKTVISAGRIAPVKAFDKLIKSWQWVAQKHPDWILEIYGDGDPSFILGLNNLIDSLNLHGKVILCGSVNNLEHKMINASMYVMSSETECFPMVLLEAMACGLPVVSFDCPNGPRNIISHNEDGILVPYNNMEALAETIIELISKPDKRKYFGENARKNINRFNSDVVMGKWLDVFSKY